MKLNRSKDWWLTRARREGDATIGAGALSLDAKPEPANLPSSLEAEETRIAFGRFVSLMRRRNGLTVERLAAAADLDASEILVIENGAHSAPEPRTIFQLARTFKLSQKRLMQLAGLSASKDALVRQEAVRFAARSESVEKLTAEENAALETFVTILSEQDSKKA